MEIIATLPTADDATHYLSVMAQMRVTPNLRLWVNKTRFGRFRFHTRGMKTKDIPCENEKCFGLRRVSNQHHPKTPRDWHSIDLHYIGFNPMEYQVAIVSEAMLSDMKFKKRFARLSAAGYNSLPVEIRQQRDVTFETDWPSEQVVAEWLAFFRGRIAAAVYEKHLAWTRNKRRQQRLQTK